MTTASSLVRRGFQGLFLSALKLVESTPNMIAARSDATCHELGVTAYRAMPVVASVVTPLRLAYTGVKPDSLLRSGRQQTTDTDLFALCRDRFTIGEMPA